MDKIEFGLSVTVVGLLVVFAGLSLLILCLIAFKYFFSERKKAPSATPAEETAPVFAAQPELPEETVPGGIAPEVIAAITAAVSAVWQKDTGFIVRRVRRIHTAPAWNRAGRDDQIYSRL